MVFIRKLDGVLTAPSHDPSPPSSIPSGQELRAVRGSLLPTGASPASCSHGARCQAGTAPRWELPPCSPGVNSILCPGRPLPQPHCPPPSLSRHSQLGRLVVEQRGAGGAELVGTSSVPELSASSPACPAVWPCFASRLLPVLLLTDIVSVGIYISLTTLSPNGIKSKAGDK